MNIDRYELTGISQKPLIKATQECIRALDGQVTLVSVANPFEPNDKVISYTDARPGTVVRDYIDPQLDIEHLAILFNGRPLEPVDALIQEVKAGDWISVSPIPRGGGGGGAKGILRIVAFAVLAVVAAPLAAGLAGMLGVTGAIGVGLVQAGVMVAGGMLINSLFPTEKPTFEQRNQESSSPTYSIGGPRSTSAEGLPVPIVYGEHILAPNRISVQTSEVVGQSQTTSRNGIREDQWLNLLFNLGEGEIEGVGQIKLDGTPVESFGEHYVEWRPGTNDQTPMGDFANVRRAISKGLRLTPDWVYHTTTSEVDKLGFLFKFPAGCLKRDANGTTYFKTIKMAVEYRLSGSGDWAPLPLRGGGTDSTIPEILQGDDPPSKIWVPFRDTSVVYTSLNAFIDGEGYRAAYDAHAADVDKHSSYIVSSIASYVPFGRGSLQSILSGDLWHWKYKTPMDPAKLHSLSDGYGYDTSGHIYYRTRNKIFYGVTESGKPKLQDANTVAYGETFPGYRFGGVFFKVDHYENRIEEESGEERDKAFYVPIGFTQVAYEDISEFSVTAKRQGSFYAAFESEVLPEGVYDVRVRRTDTEKMLNSPQYHQDQVNWDEVEEILTDQIAYVNTAVLGVAVKASNQLSRVPNVTCVVRGRKIKTRSFSDASNTYVWVTQWTDNPAWIVYDMLTNRRVARRPVPESKIDVEKFQELADYCEENGLFFNGVFDRSGQNLWDACQEVLRVAHAQLLRLGDRYTLAIDKPDVPVMMFNSTNTVKSSVKVEWLPMDDRANSVEVTYLDMVNRYERSVVRVGDQGGDEEVKPVKLEVPGIVNEEQALAHARYKLNQNKLLRHNITFEANIDAIALMVGDLFIFQSELANWNSGGRLAAGSTDTVIELDRPVSMTAGTQYQMIFQYDRILVASGSVNQQIGQFVYLDGYDGSDANRILIGGDDYEVLEIIDNGAGLYGVKVAVSGFVAGTYRLYKYDALITRNVEQVLTDGDYEQVTLTEALPEAPSQYMKWMFGPTNKVERIYRCSEIKGDNELTREIHGVEYDESVYSWADSIVESERPEARIITHVRDLDYHLSNTPIQGTNKTSINLNWDFPAVGDYRGATIYAVEYDEETDSYPRTAGEEIGVVSSNQVTFEWPMPSASRYLFWVIARGEGGIVPAEPDIPYVEIDLSTTQIGDPPAAPTALGISTTRGAVTLTWTNTTAANFRHVEVYRSTTNNFNTATLVGSTASVSYQEVLIPGTYYYWLKSVNTALQKSDETPGEMAGLEIEVTAQEIYAENVLPQNDNPTAPSNLQASIGFRKVILTWTNPTDIYFGEAEVWASDTTTRTDGGVVYRGAAEVAQFEIGTGVTKYYWIRTRSPWGNYSPFLSPTGLQVTTTTVVAQEDISAGIITADKMVAGTITAASGILADLSVTNAKIASVSAAKITSGQIGATTSIDLLDGDNNATARIGHASDSPITGLNMTPDKLGYFDGTNWLSYIDKGGDAYFGDGEESFLKVENGDVVIGPLSSIYGMDGFGGSRFFWRDIFDDHDNWHRRWIRSTTTSSYIDQIGINNGESPGVYVRIRSGATHRTELRKQFGPVIDGMNSQTYYTRVTNNPFY